jgi:2-polyprenyl-3-methyl-5-hydroxy-6-metoxy-1,4-benzoquinol methylase
VAPRYRDLAPQFFVNAYEPPIQERDASFDFIYAISVLTHLTEAHQKAWLEELNRLLAPDGRLVVSILERNAAATPMGVVARKRVDKAFTRSWLGKGAAPKHYYNTHNTVRHISGLLADQLQLVGYWPKSIRNIQSLLMFRKLTN